MVSAVASVSDTVSATASATQTARRGHHAIPEHDGLAGGIGKGRVRPVPLDLEHDELRLGAFLLEEGHGCRSVGQNLGNLLRCDLRRRGFAVQHQLGNAAQDLSRIRAAPCIAAGGQRQSQRDKGQRAQDGACKAHLQNLPQDFAVSG